MARAFLGFSPPMSYFRQVSYLHRPTPPSAFHVSSTTAAPMAQNHPSLEILGGAKDTFLPALPSLTRPYNPFPVFAWNRHVETIFAAFFRSTPDIKLRRECLRTKDDGSVSLDWVPGDDRVLPADSPLLILLPGLTGGSEDSYVRHMLIRARDCGWRVVVFNSRGCGASPVTTPQFYSASFLGDIREVVDHVGGRYPEANLYAVGWSLGANILVRYLGQESNTCRLSGAVSLCNPFNLVIADEDFHKGFNNVYDKALSSALCKIFKKHALLFEDMGGEYNIPLAANAKSVRDFDEGLTRGIYVVHLKPFCFLDWGYYNMTLICQEHLSLKIAVSFGFKSTDDYYSNACSSDSIKDVCTPLLCIQAANDPIAPNRGIPRGDIQDNPNCMLIVTPQGGHLGWVAGAEAPFGCPWTDPTVMDFLDHLERGKSNGLPCSGDLESVQQHTEDLPLLEV